MKPADIFFAFCLWVLIAGPILARAPLKVLFIGNSQIMCYNLPEMIKTLSESAPADQPRIEIGCKPLGGASLKKHWEAGEGEGSSRATIATGQWDYVVIQEIYNAGNQEFEDYAIKFDHAIKTAGSKTIVFATANATKFYRSDFASYKYPDSFKKLNDMQIAFGKKTGIPVAAAGYAWMKYLGPNPTDEQLLDLYAKDKGHPGPKGTYIYACLLYAFITGLNPAGLTNEFNYIKGVSISKEEAAKMQKAAWEQYQESIHNKPGN